MRPTLARTCDDCAMCLNCSDRDVGIVWCLQCMAVSKVEDNNVDSKIVNDEVWCGSPCPLISASFPSPPPPPPLTPLLATHLLLFDFWTLLPLSCAICLDSSRLRGFPFSDLLLLPLPSGFCHAIIAREGQTLNYTSGKVLVIATALILLKVPVALGFLCAASLVC